ncbi:Triple QxxK/R motif-containing protein [Collichthys lucidus]|uniref:Triple QxxK/R motif-containing protein n=1 Tax=Collichthys lucidus TaxID=240159 RepID=A0A4U5VJA2_COLLU|nr:Triple QxxK/R motif-containing protein [Collichthys lucidus]
MWHSCCRQRLVLAEAEKGEWGRKDASATGLPVDQYRKQIGKQDYKKTKSALKATRLKAEAKKNSSGFRMQLASQKGQQTCGHRESGSCQGRLSRGCPSSSAVWDAFLVIAAILLFVLCVYAFFYLNLSTEINLDLDMD